MYRLLMQVTINQNVYRENLNFVNSYLLCFSSTDILHDWHARRDVIKWAGFFLPGVSMLTIVPLFAKPPTWWCFYT